MLPILVDLWEAGGSGAAGIPSAEAALTPAGELARPDAQPAGSGQPSQHQPAGGLQAQNRTQPGYADPVLA